MITISIIILIALVSIPKFDDFGRRTEFNDKALAVQSLINQMGVLVRNPEKNITWYQLNVVAGSAAIVNSNNTTVKQVNLPTESWDKAMAMKCSAVVDVTYETCRDMNTAGNPEFADGTTLKLTGFATSSVSTFTLHFKPLRADMVIN